MRFPKHKQEVPANTSCPFSNAWLADTDHCQIILAKDESWDSIRYCLPVRHLDSFCFCLSRNREHHISPRICKTTLQKYYNPKCC